MVVLQLLAETALHFFCLFAAVLSTIFLSVSFTPSGKILSKMDGLVNLENVLVVGMTNRKELLDEALLRPGRMEVRRFLLLVVGMKMARQFSPPPNHQAAITTVWPHASLSPSGIRHPTPQVCMPIPLPDASGREQILAIHLRKARDAGLVSPEVDDASLAKKTDGFSGADLAGLVRSATSFAIADWRRRHEGGDGIGGGGTQSQEQQRNAGGGGVAAAGGVAGGVPFITIEGGSDDDNTARESDLGSISGDSGESGKGGEQRSSRNSYGNGPAVEITLENLEQALREVGASGGGGGGGLLRRFRGLARPASWF